MAALGAAVTIGSRTIRVLEVKKLKTGSWQVTKALIAPIADHAASDAARIAEARAALKTAQVKGPALVGLSGKELIIRYTQVPPVPDWRLEMLMNFEIQEVSEQSGGDVSAAYALLGVDDAASGDNVVLVALAKNGYLTPRLAAASEAGLDVLGGCPRAVAAFWAYKENARLPSDETVFFMHIGNENTDIAIARKGVLLFARNITGGSKLFTDAIVQNIRLDPATAEKSKITKGNITPRGKAKYRDSAEEKIANTLMGVGGHFVSAFNSSLMFAKAQTKVPDCKPSKLVLMGSGALLKGLPEYLESSLGVPVELFDPVSSLDLSLLPEKTAEALKQDQGGMAVTLGLAQMAADDQAFRVEILPAADKKKRKFLRQTAVSIAAAAVLGIALAVTWSMLSGASAQAKQEESLLAQKGAAFGKNESDLESERKRAEEANIEMRQLERLVSMGPKFHTTYDLVHSIINDAVAPFPEIYLDKISSSWVIVPYENPTTGKSEPVTAPNVSFDAKVMNVGARPGPQAYQDFSSALKTRIDELQTLKLEMGALNGDQFKFTIRAKTRPELVEKP